MTHGSSPIGAERGMAMGGRGARLLAAALMIGALVPLTMATSALAQAAGQAAAQGGKAADGPVVSMPLKDALARARAENRLLLVYIASGKRRQQEIDAFWSLPGPRQWALRHALVVKVSDSATIRDLAKSEVKPGQRADPLVFVDGKLRQVFSCGWPAHEPRMRDGNDAKRTSVGPLLRLDWTLRSIPGHFAGHQVPPMVIAPSSGVGELKNVTEWLALLERARATANAGQLGDAAGLYVGLWESAEGLVTPGLEAARTAMLTSVAGEMYSVAIRDESAKARVDVLRTTRLDAMDWADGKRVWAYLLLCRAANDHLPTMEFLDKSLNDPDAERAIPAGDRAMLEVVLPRSHWSNPLRGGDAAASLRRIVEGRGAERPEGLSEADWERLRSLRAWTLGVEGCRQYAALLRQGKDEQAVAAAKTLLDLTGEDQRAARRLELVVTALADRQGREHQRAWIAESGLAEPERAALLKLLDEQLAAARK